MFDILNTRARFRAEATTIAAAESGHHQHAALALIADILSDSVNLRPGAGWMVTYIDEELGAVTEPVLYFDAEQGPKTPDFDGGIDYTSDARIIWHPAQIIGGEPMTHARAVKMLEAK